MLLRALEARAGRFAGIAWMLAGVALFAGNDALAKWLVGDYAVGQVLAVRSAAALAALWPLFWRAGGLRLIRNLRDPALHALRIALVVAEVAFFYLAVRDLPLADTMAFYLASPLFVAALSGLLLGERVPARRWLALTIGFGGVLLVLRPGSGAISASALLAIAGSLTFALMLIVTRRLRDASGAALITTQTAGVAFAGLATLPLGGWVMPRGFDAALMVVLGVVATAAHFGINRSLQLSPAATVTPFQYTSILWAIALGAAFWGDRPSIAMLLGTALIVATGLLILRDEAAQRRDQVRGAAAASSSGAAAPCPASAGVPGGTDQ
jgi:drug/metabolite transporter (DMT)-like permease